MKYIASLPKAFKLKGQNESGFFTFEDNNIPFIAVLSPILEIHDKEWCVVVREQFNKSDKSKFASRLVFKLFEIDQSHQSLPKVRIEREIIKGRFASTNKNTEYTAIFPLKENIWLIYSIFKI